MSDMSFTFVFEILSCKYYFVFIIPVRREPISRSLRSLYKFEMGSPVGLWLHATISLIALA